jgi:hypothetical protein
MTFRLVFRVVGERNRRILEGERKLLEEEKAQRESDESSR